MPEIVGNHVRVVETPVLKIDELAGNVASTEDSISIALVKASAGAAEPWLTLHYDEWICVLKGQISLETDGNMLQVAAGKTVRIVKGTRFRPSFEVDTEYIPVCLPAFRPDRCIREDVSETDEGVSANLKKLHGAEANGTGCVADNEAPPEILYHMTTVKEWTEAKESKTAYYPKTYVADGYYTHATGVPARLLSTANHFYTDVPGDWVCLQFSRTALKNLGIHTRDEGAMPVGDKKVSGDWVQKNWICPHVIGGIPLAVVDTEYPMTRDADGKFLGITGLVD